MDVTSGKVDTFDLRGHTVLIVDDEPASLGDLVEYLECRHCKVLSARTGESGLERAEYSQPDLILLDIQLPVLDGYAVARELRSKTVLADVPIIAVTSYAMVGDRERILAAGCTGYIEKPIDPDTFMAQVERFLAIRPPAT